MVGPPQAGWLLDAGNTRLKLARWCPRAGLGTAVAEAHDGDPAAAWQRLWARVRTEHPAGQPLWGAAVLGADLGAQLQDAVAASGLVSRWAKSPPQCGVWRSGYQAPERLGVDRFLIMLGLPGLGQGAQLVASCGTAITVDVVDVSGQHLGGIIAPGVWAQRAATLAHTRFAAGPSLAAPASGLGTNTEEAINLGAIQSGAGALEALRRQHRAAQCTITGGDAELLLPWLAPMVWELAPNAVMHGLLRWAVVGD